MKNLIRSNGRIYHIIVVVIILICAITFPYKLMNNRDYIEPEEFLEFRQDNDYFVSSNVTHLGGVEEEGFIKAGSDLRAEHPSLGIDIEYFMFYSEVDSTEAYDIACKGIYNRYFVQNSSYELRALSTKSDFIRETSGKNFDRYIIRSPEKNHNTLISRVGNTLVIVKDASDYAFTQVKDLLGKIGY